MINKQNKSKLIGKKIKNSNIKENVENYIKKVLGKCAEECSKKRLELTGVKKKEEDEEKKD